MSAREGARSAGEPAEVYEALFVPALFRDWGPVVSGLAEIRAGQQVLDVACGTGALTRAVAERVGAGGAVVGLDPNPGMLAVARRTVPNVEWIEAAAEALPFADERFDAVVSQFGCMFFADQPRALGEMWRVLRPQGQLAVAVWDALSHSPGYAVVGELLGELFGASVANAFAAPFVLGNADRLLELCAAAGVTDPRVTRREGRVRFSSLEQMLNTERACVWTLGGLLNDAQFEQLLARARLALSPFVAPDGSVSFAVPALIVTAQKRNRAGLGGS